MRTWVVETQEPKRRLKDTQINTSSHKGVTASHLAMLCERTKSLEKFKWGEGCTQSKVRKNYIQSDIINAFQVDLTWEDYSKLKELQKAVQEQFRARKIYSILKLLVCFCYMATFMFLSTKVLNEGVLKGKELMRFINIWFTRLKICLPLYILGAWS